MPLILMCGTPGSGKTFRASQIAQYLTTKHNAKVIHINEEFLGIQKNKSYSSAEQEKMLRGRFKFEVERNLIGKNVVICDTLNYIKGYRYQMYCIAREQKTTYAVIYCNSNHQNCKLFNQKNQNSFNNELFEDLTKRMQVPQLKNRWDIPLFQRRQEEPTPLQQIADVILFQNKKSKDPVSTKQDQKLSEDYLSQLDQIMQGINEEVLMGKLKLKNNWSAVQLKKMKKNFVNIAKQKPQNLKVLKQGYIDYLIEADKRK